MGDALATDEVGGWALLSSFIFVGVVVASCLIGFGIKWCKKPSNGSQEEIEHDIRIEDDIELAEVQENDVLAVLTNETAGVTVLAVGDGGGYVE